MNLVDKEEELKRMAICRQCEHFVPALQMCNVCKCIMPIKVKISSLKCPVGKWGEFYRYNPDF